MRNSNRLAVLALSTLAFVTACEDDPAQPAAGSQAFLPLTTREAVLNNLEVAWDNRVPSKIDELLDDSFTFFFAPADVGGEIPEQWNRADEMAVTTAWLKSNSVPPAVGPVCRKVRVDLDLDEVSWVPLAPPANALGEALYTTFVYYSLLVEMENDITYLTAAGAQAQLTVREVAVGNGTEWRLVEWRDSPNSLVTGPGTTSSTQESSWGGIKALYH